MESAVTVAQPLSAFMAWRGRIDTIVTAQTGQSIASLEAALGQLPLDVGFVVGDSPAEFYAGAVEPRLAELDPEAR